MSNSWISLTFDDALHQHLDHAIPCLDDRELTGTFYAHLAAESFTQRLEEWRSAAQRGHELGNHTVFHPADARKSWVLEGNAIDYYTLDRMRQELEVANHLLTAIDGSTVRTFAYPCSNTMVGRDGALKRYAGKLGFSRARVPDLVDRCCLNLGSTKASYVPLVAERFLAARGGGLVKSSTIPPWNSLHRFLLPSVAVEGWSVAELKEFTARGLDAGAWVILQFHGIGGGHRMDCELEVFEQFVSWLADHHAERVKTVRQVAEAIWDHPQDRTVNIEPHPATAS